MPRKTVLLATLLPLAFALRQPVFADTPQPDPQPAQQPAMEKPGLMTRFAKLFEPLDTTKPENQHVFVIGGGSHNTAQDTPEATDKPASVATTAPQQSKATTADVSANVQADASAATAKPSTHGFKLKSGFDSGDAQKPDTQAAPSPQ